MKIFSLTKIILSFLIIKCESGIVNPPAATPRSSSIESRNSDICIEAFNELLELKSKISEILTKQEDFYREFKGKVNVRPYTTNHCKHTKNVFDSNGKFLKSLCDVHVDINYKEAEKYCMDRGMDLLMVENEEVYKGMSEFLVEFYGDVAEPWNHVAGLWINGERNGSANFLEWYVTKNGTKIPLPHGLPTADEKSYPGNCLTLKKREKYEGRNYDCKKTYWFICEYASTF